MNAGATSERVYDALKARLLSGAILPDEKQEPAALAADLNSSVTPVRDALHRLSGERLIESRPSEGFYLPHVNEPALRDLYAWNGQLLSLVVRAWPRVEWAPAADQLPVDFHQATRLFFTLFASRSDNIEHTAQLDSANERLAAARHVETRVLSGLESELRQFAVDFDYASSAAILKRIAAYHRRRVQAVPEIVRALYRR